MTAVNKDFVIGNRGRVFFLFSFIFFFHFSFFDPLFGIYIEKIYFSSSVDMILTRWIQERFIKIIIIIIKGSDRSHLFLMRYAVVVVADDCSLQAAMSMRRSIRIRHKDEYLRIRQRGF